MKQLDKFGYSRKIRNKKCIQQTKKNTVNYQSYKIKTTNF